MLKKRLMGDCYYFIKKYLTNRYYCVYCVCTVKQRGEAGRLQILLDNKGSAPIYDQIYAQIKAQIISGALREDELLPSMRNLAKDLRVSVITTKRAYDELERDGFLYTVAGKGCFVAPKNIELLREENLKALEGHLEAAARLASVCGLGMDELTDTLRLFMEGEE